MTRLPTETLAKKVQKTTRSLYMIFGGLIIILGVIYLVHSNKTATKGYALLLLEQERTRLLIEAEQWGTKVSNVLSVDSLQENQNLQMTKPDRVTFMKPDSNVAGIVEQRLN